MGLREDLDKLLKRETKRQAMGEVQIGKVRKRIEDLHNAWYDFDDTVLSIPDAVKVRVCIRDLMELTKPKK